jgi:site-specific recombinase XerD
MIDAMVLRGFRPRTQVSYLRAVSQMARHYHRSPELITDQEVQAYLLHLVRDRQLARTSVNQVSSAVRFVVCEVLGQADRRSRIPMALTPQRLPEVLSRAEVAAVLAAPMSLKARTLLMTAYATGMRVSELCNLRGCDIDSSPDRMCIRVVAGKGGHDRYSLLTPELLVQLRLYWRQCRHHARPEDWLFPARLDPSNALDTRSAGRYFHIARNAAGIDKVGGIHTLRHYSASGNMPSRCRERLAGAAGRRISLGIVLSPATLRGATGDDRDSCFQGPARACAVRFAFGVRSDVLRTTAGSGIRRGVRQDVDAIGCRLRDLARPTADRGLRREAGPCCRVP